MQEGAEKLTENLRGGENRLHIDGRYGTITFGLRGGQARKTLCGCGGMADASDSKSDGGDLVWVQVPPSAGTISVEEYRRS